MNLNWKKPLFYILLPVLIFLCFVGFPPPFAPSRATKPAQEQSETIKKEDGQKYAGHVVAKQGETFPPLQWSVAQSKPVHYSCALMPNTSLHPGPATAGVVSPACASGSIVTHRAYNTCLRGPGELER